MIVSIIILTKDAGEGFRACLDGIFRQVSGYPFEVIVIDSGSKDGTPEIASEYPVRLERIEPGEFGHGKTRNLGARLAQGKYLVYITQDAVPASDVWLERLVSSVEAGENVAGAYSRQIPKEDSFPSDARIVLKAFGEKSEIKDSGDLRGGWKKRYLKRTPLMSNVSSCIKRSVWDEIPFNETLLLLEDQEWAKRAFEKGYRVVYEPDSAVYHSHSYPLSARFKRYFDGGVAQRQTFNNSGGMTLPFVFLYPPFYSVLDVRFMMSRGYSAASIFRWFFYSLAAHFTESIGFWIGLKARYLPAGLCSKLTINGRHFDFGAIKG